MTWVRVEPEGFEAASSVIGDGVANTAFRAGWALVDALDSCGGMAGSDPTGSSFAAAYDAAARAALGLVADAVNAGYRLADLLQRTGFNHGAAESLSTPGHAVQLPADQAPYADRYCSYPGPPTASGAGGSPPAWWWLIEHSVGYVWPDGHQDVLRASSVAWRACAAELLSAADDVQRTDASIGAEQSPESADARTVCGALATAVRSVAEACRELGGVCEQYAEALDSAHSQVEQELAEFVAETVGVQVVGALASVFTLGGSEAVAQTVEAERVEATAVEVHDVIEDLIDIANTAGQTIANLTSRLNAIKTQLATLTSATPVVATTEAAEPLPATPSPAQLAESRLAIASGLDLSQLPVGVRQVVINVIDRARLGKLRFPGHDGKDFDNRSGVLPPGDYKEWTASDTDRKVPHRVIIEGSPKSPVSIWYWDHRGLYIRIGPMP